MRVRASKAVGVSLLAGAVILDGTGGGTGPGCGNNPNGAGFSGAFAYYELYCPVSQQLPFASTPNPTGNAPALYQCSTAPPSASPVTPDTGTGSALVNILT